MNLSYLISKKLPLVQLQSLAYHNIHFTLPKFILLTKVGGRGIKLKNGQAGNRTRGLSRAKGTRYHYATCPDMTKIS